MAADGISCSRRNAWGRGSDVRKKETGGKADRFVPVSYTHLDVYKRQDHFLTEEELKDYLEDEE